MSLITTEFPLALRMAQAIANPLFPKLDTWLRSGRHISADDLDNHSFLLEYHDELERFERRNRVEVRRGQVLQHAREPGGSGVADDDGRHGSGGRTHPGTL